MGKEETVRLPSSLFILLSVAAAFLPCRVNAQAVGNIVGSVSDPGRAVVPGATVTATEKSTNFSRSTTTSSTGNYSLPRLPVGTYTVTAEAAGFEKASTDTKLDVEENREVDFTLVVKGVATSVDVAATTEAINTTTGTIGGLVEGRQVANLPLNGRDITNLMLMQPGQTPETNSSFGFNINTSGNGNRGTTGSSFLDGMDSSDNELGGGQFGNFNLDAIAEFRVLQNNYS
ncbi:MAG: Oar protein, partial [Bryobacterales bacterium]|nr:Oar protein [Bryobacterales bacterium]